MPVEAARRLRSAPVWRGAVASSRTRWTTEVAKSRRRAERTAHTRFRPEPGRQPIHRRLDRPGCTCSVRRRRGRFAVPPRVVVAHAAQPDVSDESLALEIRQRGKTLLQRVGGPFVDAEHVAKVDDVENIEAKVRRLSRTALINSFGDNASSTDPSVPRRAPTLVTMTRSFG